MPKLIFPENESKLLEFKSEIPKNKYRKPNFEPLVKTVIAFANGSGGRIIIGVDDQTHEITGIKDQDRISIYDDFPNCLYDSTQPSLITHIYEQNFGKQSILIIETPTCSRKPYFLKNKGIKNGTYIRVGTNTRKATEEYIQDLSREAERISFDEEIVPTDNQCLSEGRLKDFYDKRVTNKRLLADRVISPKPANNSEYRPTVAGVLMFSESPELYIPEALVRCTRFKGISGRNIAFTEDITGTIEKQATKTFSLLKTWLTTYYELEDIKLKEKMIIPADALREAIINALLHRKYSIHGAVKIAMYDDRLEVLSPGDFPGLVDTNNLGDGTTYLRNPILVRLAYHLRIIESRGTGIRLIYDSCKKAGLKKPLYSNNGDFVKVVFYFEPDKLAYKSGETALEAYAKQLGEITAKQAAKYLDVSHNTAIRYLNKLVQSDKLSKKGKGPSVRYYMK